MSKQCYTHLSDADRETLSLGCLLRAYPDDMRQHLSPEIIYVGLYVLSRGALRSELLAALRRHARRVGLGREGRIDGAKSPT